jgi:hypothetical protein
VKRHCCERLVGVRLTVLEVVAAIAIAIAAVMIANLVPLARVYAPRRRDGQLLPKGISNSGVGYLVLVGHSLWHVN